ncbi:MAG: hypothetical protein U9N49_04700, partial [Campylobacterota bacterium]|nr:hypothetical protein [Campylobacterota bacterium]
KHDYTREPYLSSLEHQSVMKPTRDFFENLEEGEEEFIVPLYYHNKVIGFWVFSITLTNIDKMENFKLLVHDYAKEVSHLLFNRSQFVENKKDSRRDIKKLLTVEVKPKVIKSIEKNLSIIEKRMLMDEVILDAIGAQMIVYDLFGRVLHINSPMAQTLQEEQVSAFTMTESEMIAKVTSIDLAKVKKIIREVISTQQPYTQLVNLKHSQKKYILNISAITKKNIDNKFTIDYFFDSCGIICEFHDFSYIEHRYYYKKDIINYAMDHNQKRLSKIDHLTTDTKELSDILHDTLFAFNKLKTLINQDIISKGGDDLYPLDIHQIIEIACSATKQNFSQKPIDFDINSSGDLPLGMISISNAQRYIQNLLAMLMDDSEEYGKISVNLEAKEHTLDITMKSYGSGMPQKQLDNYLNASIPPQKYRLVKKTKKGIVQAMGSLKCFSQLGDGIRIELTLKSVYL